MCSCKKCHAQTIDMCFYVPFGIIFVTFGIIQIISGFWYLITKSVIILILQIGIGCWSILAGISGSMFACFCPSMPKKHEFILYCSLSILIFNVLNLISLEVGQTKEIFTNHLKKVMNHEFEIFNSENGRFITTYSSLISALIAFIQSQITFCLLNRSQIVHRKEKCLRQTQNIDTDQTADLEYVIPKKNEMNGSRKSSIEVAVQAYAKSWVFEGSAEDSYPHLSDSMPPSSETSTPTSPVVVDNTKLTPNDHQIHIKQGHSQSKNKNKNRRISKTSDATSDRFNPQMSSFSRCATPSPVPNSGLATPTNVPYNDYMDASIAIVNHHSTVPKSNRLTIEYVPSETVAVLNKHTTKVIIQPSNGPSSVSSQQDDSQYASMLVELEQSLNDKKHQLSTISPDDVSVSTDKYGSSKSSSKDLEFSKELEAALQLIQDLETPSEGPIETPSKFARSESEKTLSAAVSLPSPDVVPFTPKTSPNAQTPHNGKHKKRSVIHIEPSSQSTSGYSSPKSFSSNVQSSQKDGRDSTGDASISPHSDKSNIVRIYIDQNGSSNSSTNNSNTINPNNNNLLTKGHILNASNLIDTIEMKNIQPNESLNRSFLLFKKRSKLMPHSDFRNRIFKSECLAYLSDEELAARQKTNRDVIRKIEQSVAQKVRGIPRYDETA